jgi:anti-sigma B factor antagonist
MGPSFQAEIDELGDGVVALCVVGELDQATLPVLRRKLDPVVDDRHEALLIDLSRCDFIDSSGLAAFVAARERIAADGGRRFAVCCPDNQVRKLMELTGLDGALGLTDSRDNALAALRDGLSPKPA